MGSKHIFVHQRQRKEATTCTWLVRHPAAMIVTDKLETYRGNKGNILMNSLIMKIDKYLI